MMEDCEKGFERIGTDRALIRSNEDPIRCSWSNWMGFGEGRKLVLDLKFGEQIEVCGTLLIEHGGLIIMRYSCYEA
jgi:hypothetical protein